MQSFQACCISFLFSVGNLNVRTKKTQVGHMRHRSIARLQLMLSHQVGPNVGLLPVLHQFWAKSNAGPRGLNSKKVKVCVCVCLRLFYLYQVQIMLDPDAAISLILSIGAG